MGMEVCQGRCPSPWGACLQPPPSHGPDTPEHVTAAELCRRYPEHPPGGRGAQHESHRVSICCKSPRPGNETQPGLLDPLASWDHVAPMLLTFFLSLIVLPHMNHYCCITAFISQWKNMKVWVTQSCLTLGNPMQYSPPGSSVLGILQVRVLEWAAILFSRGSSRPRDQTQISHTADWFFAVWSTR